METGVSLSVLTCLYQMASFPVNREETSSKDEQHVIEKLNCIYFDY